MIDFDLMGVYCSKYSEFYVIIVSGAHWYVAYLVGAPQSGFSDAEKIVMLGFKLSRFLSGWSLVDSL